MLAVTIINLPLTLTRLSRVKTRCCCCSYATTPTAYRLLFNHQSENHGLEKPSWITLRLIIIISIGPCSAKTWTPFSPSIQKKIDTRLTRFNCLDDRRGMIVAIINNSGVLNCSDEFKWSGRAKLSLGLEIRQGMIQSWWMLNPIRVGSDPGPLHERGGLGRWLI